MSFFQAAQPRGERAAPDPHPAARQPHDRRPGALPAPAVERGPGHPQLGGHLIDRQQRVIRGSGFSGRGGGGPAGSGWRSRGRPVRGSATTDAPLRPPRQVRPPPGRRRRRRPGAAGPGTGKEERPRGRAARRGWRAARPCRRGRPAGAGAGWSRAVTSCAPSPLPGVEAAGPVPAGGAGWPAARDRRHPASTPPAASSRPAPAGGGLDTRPRATRRCGPVPAPPEEGTAPADGPAAGPGTAKGARWRAPHGARHRRASACCRRAARYGHARLRAARYADWRICHGPLPRASWFSVHYRNRVFRAFFHVPLENRFRRAAGALRMFGRVPAAHPLQAGAFTARSRRSLPSWPPSSETARYSVSFGTSGSVPTSPRTRRTSDPSSVPAIGTAGWQAGRGDDRRGRCRLFRCRTRSARRSGAVAGLGSRSSRRGRSSWCQRVARTSSRWWCPCRDRRPWWCRWARWARLRSVRLR